MNRVTCPCCRGSMWVPVTVCANHPVCPWCDDGTVSADRAPGIRREMRKDQRSRSEVSAADLIGSAPHLTGGLSPVAYIRSMRDDDEPVENPDAK